MNLLRISILGFVIFTLFSCNKNNSELDNRDNVRAQNNKLEGGTVGSLITNDSIMINLVSNWISISMRTTDDLTLNAILADDVVDTWEENLIATTMGFIDFADYTNYLANLKRDYLYLD